jgi:nitrate reductase NapAB chaperone NapD
MHHLELDFTRPVPRYNQVLLGALLVLVIVLTTFFVYQQQLLSKEIDRKKNQIINKQDFKSRNMHNPELERQAGEAHQTQRNLNIPWGSMLSALESAQKENLNIRLLSVQPKPEKGEVLIAGEATEFDALVNYLNSLRQQPGMGDAVLLNQHWEQSIDVEDTVKHDKLMFNLSVIWLP